MKEIANIHLLLIEDNARYLTILERRLRRFGYEHLTLARNAAEARECLQQAHFEVIVSDMRMEQDDSGFEIVDLVQERKLSSIVIILTANDSVKDCRQALRAKRAWDYISKGQEDGSALQLLHESIQDAIKYFNHWGNRYDEQWLEANLPTLSADYQGQYVAVLNNAILASAATREALEQLILERNLPLFLTVIRKIEPPAELTIFVEGPTDVDYIKTAAHWLNHEDLLKRIHLDNIGNQQGNLFGGERNMTNSFEFLKHNPPFRANKVLFLFDQDVEDKNLPLKEDMVWENLYVRRTGKFNKEKKGTEYLFNDEVLEAGFAAGFIAKNFRVTVTDPYPKPQYQMIDKTKLCQWLCDQRQNSPADFANFEPIFQLIQEILDQP